MLHLSAKRSVTLDMVRGVSALLIVLFHYTHHYRIFTNGYKTYDFGIDVYWGYAAVCTFFMLSGFLATNALSKKGIKPSSHLRKKLRRFYPAYWACMSVTTIVLFFFFVEERISVGQYIANLTMVSPLMRVPFVDGVYWSMQNELIFMLFVCALIPLGQKWQKRIVLIWIITAVILTCFPLKALRFARIAFISDHAHSFVAGIAISWFMRRTISRRMLCVLLTLCCVNASIRYGLMSAHVVFFVCSGTILLLSGQLDKIISHNNILVRCVSWIAVISYPLYLLHQMAGFAILRQLHSASVPTFCAFFITIAVILGVSWLIHKYVECKF